MARITDSVAEEEEKTLGKMFVTRALLLTSVQTKPQRSCQQIPSDLLDSLIHCPLYFDIVLFCCFFAFSVADCPLYCGPASLYIFCYIGAFVIYDPTLFTCSCKLEPTSADTSRAFSSSLHLVIATLHI